MESNELKELKDKIQSQENPRLMKFTLYTITMIILGISIGVWSIREGSRAKDLQLRNAIIQKKTDSLESRIQKANDRLLSLQEKLLNSHLINGHIRIGLDNFYSKRYDLAIKEYDEALKLDPENFVLYDLKGYSQMRLRRFEEAILSLNKSVSLNPNYGWGYYNLALAYWANGSKDNSRTALMELLKVSPEMKTTVLNDWQFAEIIKDELAGKLLH